MSSVISILVGIVSAIGGFTVPTTAARMFCLDSWEFREAVLFSGSSDMRSMGMPVVKILGLSKRKYLPSIRNKGGLVFGMSRTKWCSLLMNSPV